MKAVVREIKQAQVHDWMFTFDLEGQAADSLRVTAFSWDEPLSQLYSGSVTLAGRDTHINLADCVDRLAVLTISHKYGDQPRYLSGVVTSIASVGLTGQWALYRLTIQPDLYRLSLTTDARIFQTTSVPEIVKTVLNEQGVRNHTFQLKDTHLPREYCVQYQESHLAFINRLLAEEGLLYFWTHGPTGAQLVLADHNQFAPLLADPGIEYNSTPSGAVKGQFISALAWQESLCTTDLKQRDYCFKKPFYNQQHDQVLQREGGEAQIYQRYNAYGRYKDGDSGKRFTQYQLESLRAHASTGNGESNAPHLSAGHLFELTEYPVDNLNRPYFITHVAHNGQQPQALEALAGNGSTFYRNTFQLYTSVGPSWRPPQPVKPRVDGPQMAHVVGPEGEEIYCDEHGRVKVQFPWDLNGQQNEHSSCWIRVSQGWAGSGWGAVAVPQIGQEVIVDFLEGDPDQPIITGRTYHAVNTPPYGLPANKTRMSIKSKTHKGKGYNELRFEDEKGLEQVLLHAQKDQDIVIGHDRREHIKQDRHLRVENNRVEEVRNNSTSKVDLDRTEATGRKLSQTVGEEHALQVGKNYHLKTGQTQYFQSGRQIVLESGEELTIRSSGGFIKIDASGITLQGKVVNINTGGNSPGAGLPVQANVAKAAMLATTGALSELSAPPSTEPAPLEVDTGPGTFTPRTSVSALSDSVQQAAQQGLPSIRL